MPESKAMIGLRWEPKLRALPFQSKTTSMSGSGSVSKSRNEPQSTSLWKPNQQLIDGLFLPPNDPSKVNKLLRKQVKDTAGTAWFDMPAPTLTPELKKDLQLLKVLFCIPFCLCIFSNMPHLKGFEALLLYNAKAQVGTVVESVTDYYSGRMTKKEKKPTLADELLSDPAVRQYRKRKVREIEERNRPAGNEKWKIKGRQTFKRAKQRRH
ncbi:rRNA-processing fcf2 [Gossypium australe]|uniref:rRNA-processing fcf2 n=1 Tax=Gossypium australe TaxID=47621 RepID=A0A5B6WTB9_9ROSI|nr:rRNA-processing fcf2 [Gossypium australe]